MPQPNTSKPEIVVVALDIHPHRGSEPGKGWWWSNALSPFFKLHIVTQPQCVEACLPESSVHNAGWMFHPTQSVITTWKFPTGYRQYAAWLQEALQIATKIIQERPILGLYHVTLGSFRVLPKYESLAIPYVIGPLGGGECSPMKHLWSRPVPLAHKLSETLRPLVNNAFAAMPHLRATLKSAAMVLATSRETEGILQRMGARKTAVVFPDAYDQAVSPESVLERRATQFPDLRSEIRLLWQGRPLWWKGPDIALLLVWQARAAGLRLRLTMVSNWDGPFGTRIGSLIQQYHIESFVDLRPLVSREEFLRIASEHHGFLATSLHDSGGIPLLEAQALGLPCFTLALGGNRESACPESGVSQETENTEAFLARSIECLRRWQEDPAIWFQEASAAVNFSGKFTNLRLQSHVRDIIVPAFTEKAG